MSPERSRGRKTSIIVINNSEHSITPFQFRLLKYLSGKDSRSATVKEIHEEFYQLEKGPAPIATVKAIFNILRKKINNPDEKPIIETVTEKRGRNIKIKSYRLRKGTKIEFPEEE
jgi:DNA-binding response OmpR family regulator